MMSEDLAKLKIDKAKATFQRRKRASLKMWIGAIAFMASAVTALYLFVFNPTFEVEVVTISLAYPSQSLTSLNASGYVVAQRKAAVSSKATGRLEWLGVEEGSKVKKNEIIAQIEDSDVAAARDQAEANVNNAKSSLDQARAELDDATLNYKRNKELASKGYISRMDFDTADARYKRAQAGVAGAEAAINSMKAALKAAEVVVEYTKIRAPFDAVVLTKDADVGDVVTPLGAAANAKASVVTIADMTSLKVEADVSESNLGKVKLDQPCEILLDALPDKRFRGTVHMIVPTADRSKASVMVKVRFLDQDPRILPEMSAKVAFLERAVTNQEERPKVVVNPGAIISRDGHQTVFLVTSNQVKEVTIRTGERMGDTLEILDGVKVGDKVVLKPPKRLKNGSKISIKEG
ncbi:MAG TPA: efflux RND transporter periplasmic adaptor subunit [Nitrospirota bacterium]|nr:efflux RND transporter periplasmic adaptor subunit [Nitrospirota bacterium]